MITQEKVDVADLACGMYVCELDRPWLDTPFMLQGFVIESDEDIEKLRQHCKFVYVERHRSTGDAYRALPEDKAGPPFGRAGAPGGVQYADGGSGAADGIVATIKHILMAAFGRGALAQEAKAKAPATGAVGGDAIDSGERVKPARGTRSRFTESEIKYLVADEDAGGTGIPIHDTGVAREREGLLDTIRSWFGSGARVKGTRAKQQAEEAGAPPPIYPDRATFDQELPKASAVHRQVEQVVERTLADIRADKQPEMEQIQEAVVWMVESVLRNPDGLLWLARLKDHNVRAYDHGLNVSIYLLGFGRHLGLPKITLEALGTAGMMQDIGKVRLPPELLNKFTALTATEYEVLKTHVAHSLEILQSSSKTSQVILDTVAQHHERIDGSGYPAGITNVSMLAAMAGIVDTYAAMTAVGPFRGAAAPQEVLQRLYSWRGKIFNAELVEQFIQFVGVFPVGSLVELNTGEVAVVVSHDRTKRLKPRLMLLLDHEKQPYRVPVMLDLMSNPLTPVGTPYRMLRGLKGGAYGINVEEKIPDTWAQPHP